MKTATRACWWTIAEKRIVWPSESGYSNNAACVGGGTFSYGAQAWRYMEKDFRMRSTYGAVAGSTLEDWPIGYSDLEPYYEKAEWEIGRLRRRFEQHLPGRAATRACPCRRFRQTRSTRSCCRPPNAWAGTRSISPCCATRVPYNGRAACMRCRWCVGFACEVNARTGTHNTVIPAALATGNCELRTGCMAREILLDDRGQASGVAYFDANDRLQRQTADLVIVSCGAVESARLLLNTRHRLFPNGLGNRYDWVGRNLHAHTYPAAVGLFDYETYDDIGPGASIAICDFNHGNPGLAGGGMLANEFIRLPYQFMNQVPPWVPRWGQAHKDFVRNAYKRTIAIMGPVQEMPMFDARVQVDPKVKDYWGIPVARLSGRKHPHTLEIARFMAGKAEAWLKEAGAVQTWQRIPGPVVERGPAPGRHLPHGQRSEDLGGRQAIAGCTSG